ncbi:MAG: NADPH-dependent glutamate synthase [Candidatus Ratteibacteria bacterium]|jgi:glutamate synthase (NADPH/NADH) small chain
MARKEPLKQSVDDRIKNFNEVSSGLSEEDAVTEALRCLQCKRPKCVAGCPVGIDIPAFIAKIAKRDFIGALKTIKEKNALPGICGRVCPQETQCEGECILKRKSEPIAIGLLERFAADSEKGTQKSLPVKSSSKPWKVAVIGSGPAGLTCASELAVSGISVTIFESLHEPGGVLTYGIPEFRLPKKIVREEIGYIKSLGVEVRSDFLIGRTLTLEDLKEMGYDAFFIGAGAGLPTFMGIPGENLLGVYSANEFLTRVNLMKAYRFPATDTPIVVSKQVAVIGGGNVALDSARSALRLGAEVTVVYRRSEEEMPARREEFENAREEGILFSFLTQPLAFEGDQTGHLTGLHVISMKLGAPDESGRARPVPIEGSEQTLQFGTAIVAIGQRPNPILTNSIPDLSVGKGGIIIADPETGATTIPGVFAGGDITTGAATVISAMGAGKKAASAIASWLEKEKPVQ